MPDVPTRDHRRARRGGSTASDRGRARAEVPQRLAGDQRLTSVATAVGSTRPTSRSSAMSAQVTRGETAPSPRRVAPFLPSGLPPRNAAHPRCGRPALRYSDSNREHPIASAAKFTCLRDRNRFVVQRMRQQPGTIRGAAAAARNIETIGVRERVLDNFIVHWQLLMRAGCSRRSIRPSLRHISTSASV